MDAESECGARGCPGGEQREALPALRRACPSRGVPVVLFRRERVPASEEGLWRCAAAMPCKDCEKNPKLRTAVICPDPWINGAREDQTSAARKKSENKLLTSRARYSPYGGGGLGLNQKCSI